jgi:putative hemolysin
VSLSATLLSFALCLVLSAVFSGSETGFYSISRVRLEADARAGRRSARLVQRLMRDERGLLITILIGNNLVLELVTNLGDDAMGRVLVLPDEFRELALTAILTPVIFLAGELMPKDLFRHRPHTLLGIAAPVVAAARVLFLPLSLTLRVVAVALERLFGLREQIIERAFGREAVLSLLAEGARSGTVAPHAQVLARNVLELRSIPVSQVMVPWAEVQHVSLDPGGVEARQLVRASQHTRLPVVEADGRSSSYLHQLDVLGSADDGDLERLLRPLPALDPQLPVDRALARMRLGGLRLAVVGDPARPLGVVSLKDLVERIAGDLGDW